MKKTCNNSDLKISYSTEGKGTPILLIHGYLETSNIWYDFSKELSKDFTVISVDLPGYGESELYEEPFTMCKYAESVKSVLENESIEKAFIVGHSMGGYVALAFAENYPEKLNALCLFHSNPFSDSDEKKIMRDKSIIDVEAGKKEQIIKNHVPNIFNPENVKKFSKEIEDNLLDAMKISEAGIIASLKTMRDRNNRQNILKNLKVPYLHVHGKKDIFISDEVVNKIDFPSIYEFVTLENSGHAGFVEEKENSIKTFKDFVKKYLS
jgi:pimeloyl-ACP methyl ester carboxylesterase